MSRRPLLAALVIALASCGDDRGIVGAPTVNRCAHDAECREGVCNQTTHRCVAVTHTEVFFRVVPATLGDDDSFPTLTPPRSIRTGEAVDLALRQRRTVYGTVATPHDGDMTGDPVAIPATVVFTPSDMPDVVAPVEAVAQTMALPDVSTDIVPHTWAATLSDGTFDVIVRPALALRGRVPPRFEARFDVRSDSVFQRFDIVYPAAYSRWSGVVHNHAGMPVSGMLVRAIDPTRNNIEVSTVAVTAATDGGDAGAFSIAMAPGAPQDWVLRVTSNVNAQAGLVVDVPRQACARLDPTGHAVAIDLPTDVGLPIAGVTPPPGPMGDPTPRCTGCVLVNASVEGHSANGTRHAMRGATVTLRTAVSTAGGALGDTARSWFEDRVQTDADGSFATWLIPGDYEVVIEPPDENFANTVRHAFRVRSDARVQSGQVFTVDPRLSVEGRVLTASGEPLRAAHVQAVPFQAAFTAHPCLDEVDMRTLAPSANPNDTTTSADGSYRLALDPGLYRIVVDPPAGAGFATTLAQMVCVASGIRAVDVVMDSPVEVHGVVRDPRGVPAPGARVEAVVRVREAPAVGVTVRVARTTAGVNGAYTLLVPADSATAP